MMVRHRPGSHVSSTYIRKLSYQFEVDLWLRIGTPTRKVPGLSLNSATKLSFKFLDRYFPDRPTAPVAVLGFLFRSFGFRYKLMYIVFVLYLI